MLRLPQRAHQPAAAVIDFASGRWAQIHRPGRAARTLSRIAAGRRAHGDRFVMPYYGSGSGLTGRGLCKPLGTVTTRDRWALVDGDRMRMLTADECRVQWDSLPTTGYPTATEMPSICSATPSARR